MLLEHTIRSMILSEIGIWATHVSPNSKLAALTVADMAQLADNLTALVMQDRSERSQVN